MRKTDTVIQTASKLKHSLLLQGMSIFTRFGAMSIQSYGFFFDSVRWLIKNANHNIKTMEQQKSWKPIIPKQNVIDT